MAEGAKQRGQSSGKWWQLLCYWEKGPWNHISCRLSAPGGDSAAEGNGDNTLRSGSSRPNPLKAHTAIAPRGLSSLLAPRPFSWQVTPAPRAHSHRCSFRMTPNRAASLLFHTNTRPKERALLQETTSNTTGMQRAKERLVAVSILTVLE